MFPNKLYFQTCSTSNKWWTFMTDCTKSTLEVFMKAIIYIYIYIYGYIHFKRWPMWPGLQVQRILTPAAVVSMPSGFVIGAAASMTPIKKYAKYGKCKIWKYEYQHMKIWNYAKYENMENCENQNMNISKRSSFFFWSYEVRRTLQMISGPIKKY